MSIYQLLGTNGKYLFDPENKAIVLKEQGSFCNVYLGVNVDDKSKVIIKKLNTDLVDNIQAVERFTHEALIRVHHPNIAQTLDYIRHEKDHFVVRQFIEGCDLQSVMKDVQLQKKLTLKFYIQCAVNVLEALEELHKHNTFHCDIRPSSIIAVNKKGTTEIDPDYPDIRLIDLGLAHRHDIKSLDTHEKIPFTWLFSPPEQILNQSSLINATTDLYSLGISLYIMITKEIPFFDSDPVKRLNNQLNNSIKKNNRLPNDLFLILQKATHKQKFTLTPDKYSLPELQKIIRLGQQGRYQTAAAFKKDLLNMAEHPEKRVKKRWFDIFRQIEFFNSQLFKSFILHL